MTRRKSEIRNPKAEGRREGIAAKERKELKEEFNVLRSLCSFAATCRSRRLAAPISAFGFRVSFGLRLSDFGF